jgi:hypothetical protein
MIHALSIWLLVAAFFGAGATREKLGPVELPLSETYAKVS